MAAAYYLLAKDNAPKALVEQKDTVYLGRLSEQERKDAEQIVKELKSQLRLL
ncbi:hypothetical protein [Aliikangiella maris]|uniref:Uncharacterized protein n=2 Tax=Aliikangiella maris TaxID=3162458 RepID=A0ABV3MQ14_9GAMM